MTKKSSDKPSISTTKTSKHNNDSSDKPSISTTKTSKHKKDSLDKPSISTTKTSNNEQEIPAIRFIGELDELTRSDLNNLINDPKYDFVFKNLKFVNNLEHETEKSI